MSAWERGYLSLPQACAPELSLWKRRRAAQPAAGPGQRDRIGPGASAGCVLDGDSAVTGPEHRYGQGTFRQRRPLDHLRAWNAAGKQDLAYRRAVHGDLLAGNLDMVQLRAGARVVVTRLERCQERIRFEGFGAHLNPGGTARRIPRLEMGVVGGIGSEAMPPGKQKVGQVPAVGTVIARGQSVVDLDRVRRVEAFRVGQGQQRCCGMRHPE